MREPLTNLLPPERRRWLRRDARYRLAVVAVALAIVLIGVAGVLLLPTYVYLSASAEAKKARLASMEQALSSADEAALSARLDSLSKNAAELASLKGHPSPSGAVREALAVAHPGVALSGITYAAPSGQAPGSLVLAGTAATRDTLRRYQLALQGAPFSAGVSLPVSTFAQDADLSFSITVTLKP
jgi:hypothetical protein